MKKKSRNCFVSYHHGSDQCYIEELREVIHTVRIADHSLKEDISHKSDQQIYSYIRNRMRNCSVTVVLIGSRSGYRKWIDWEIWASLRKYKHPSNPLKSFKPNGLLGIYLPTYSHSVPDRLQSNIESGYAISMKWENLHRDFESKVNYAFWNRSKIHYKIRNGCPRMKRNYVNILGLRV